jgi:hypothetical protein
LFLLFNFIIYGINQRRPVLNAFSFFDAVIQRGLTFLIGVDFFRAAALASTSSVTVTGC